MMLGISRCAHDAPLLDGRDHRRIRDGAVADGFLVHVGFVREVEQVVVDEAEVGLDVMIALARRPAGPAHPVHVGNEFFVGEIGRAKPYPDEAMALGDGEGRDLAAARRRVLSRRVRAGARGVEAQAVVAALHVVIDEIARRQRHETVRAAILHGDDATRRRAPENHGLVEEGARENLALDVFREGRDIPAVPDPHGHPPPMLSARAWHAARLSPTD